MRACLDYEETQTDCDTSPKGRAVVEAVNHHQGPGSVLDQFM
jgi:hypothetical protein